VFLEATRPDFQKIPLGVIGIQNAGGPEWLGGRLEEVLKADIRRSLVFSLVDLPSLGIKVRDVGTGPHPAFKQAKENGVSVLGWGKAGAKQGDKDADVSMDGFVYDGESDEIVGGKRYVGSSSVIRLMAHRFADELVFRYTGEPGIARTKIAYVSEQGTARELFVMDYDGYEPRQLTSDGFLNLMPRWSPDRRFLVFTAYRNRNTQDIDMIELATGKRWTIVSLAGLNITPAL
jgi:TolB protein